MADLEEDDNDGEETVMTTPANLIEWERIQSPSTNGGWSIINNSLDRPTVVFPPVNHEGPLDHILSGSSSPNDDVKEIDFERVVLPPSPLPTPRSMMPTIGDAPGGWWEAGLKLFCLKVAGIASTFRKFAAARGFQMPFKNWLGYVAPLVGAMMCLLMYLRFRQRRRIQRSNRDDLIRSVREKDEEMLQKMNELVHLVAGMNDVVLALTSRVASSVNGSS